MGTQDNFETAQNLYSKGRKLYQSYKEPSRKETRTGSAQATIGAAPVNTKPADRSENYESTLAAKRASDREMNAERERRYAAEGKVRSFGVIKRSATGRQATIPGGSGGPGRGAANGGSGGGAVASLMESMPWMASPLYWAGIGGIAWMLWKRKKKGKK